ncbi:MAG: hypothetical protein II567_07465 [Candidatus Riflebacteria bacterium]|nr:hypothetical protein [Candidatus Riflebacteria bacterium]
MIATETSTIASSAAVTAKAASVSSNVASIPALPPGEEIYDLMGTQTMDYPWMSLLGQIALAILCLYLLWLFYSWLTAPVERKRVPIVQSPEVQAIRAIKRLKLSEIWEKRNIKSICENVAVILKNYAYDEYKIGIGAAATTDEFVMAVINEKVRNEVTSKIKEMLNFCDEIRYTGSDNAYIEQEDLVNTLEGLINTRGWRK